MTLKQQKYPVSLIKVGVVLYKFEAFTYDDGSSAVELQEWHVRSIQRKRGTQTSYGVKKPLAEYYQDKYVNITQKIKGVTWGKRSRKNGDYGFLKSIPEYFRKQFRVGNDLPSGIFTTQLSALKYAIKDKEESINRCLHFLKEESDPIEISEWEIDIAENEKELKLLKSRLTRLNNNKSKSKAA
ncbi:hypothetical protein WE348_23215 (plasmid) [Alteromonas macleodii]|uniref:hypothetical protein n=1 Tax=Alteromonas macleodii TaxID=28108 RepID=UPI0030CD2EAF